MSNPSPRSGWRCALWLLTVAICAPFPCAPPVVHAQSSGLGSDSGPYVTKTWTTEEGLPQNSVWSIGQDDLGNLWVGTLQGIARFDGRAFTTYNASTTKGLAGNRVHAIVQSSGRLWIGTENGVSIRADREFRQVEGPSHVSSIDEGPEGMVWLAGQSGLYRSTGRSVKPVPLSDSLTIQWIWDVEGVSRDSAWIVTKEEDLLLYHDGTFQRSSLITPDLSVWRVAKRPNGPLWVATTSSVISIQNGTRTRYSYEGIGDKKVEPKEVRVAPSGTVWVTTYQSGLFRLADTSFRRVDGGGAIPERVAGLHRDDTGQWWVGTLRSGLIRLRSRLFHRANVPQVANDPMHGVYADESGTVWVGTDTEGLLKFDGVRASRWTTRHGLPDNSVWSVIRDQSGALWVSTAQTGVVRRKNGGFEPMMAADGDPFFKVHVFYRDPDRGVWIGSARKGIHRYIDGSLRKVLSPEHLPSDVRSLHRNESGALWIGTRSDGVARYEDEGLTWYDSDDGVPYESVRDVYETEDGTIWIATYGGGIARFDSTAKGQSFTPVTPADGLPDGTIHAIREAPNGMFWMTSNKGVFRVSRAQVESVADGRRKRLFAQTFGPTDGMPIRECNGNIQPAISRGPNGHFWIPTMEGLTTVDPHDPRLAVPDSLPVRVTEVRADGTPRPLDSLRLGPDTYRLAIDFSATSLRHADDLSFRYRLDDGPWTPAQGRRTAEFTTLDAGTHRFEVQATIDGETWYTPHAPLQFTVTPHFYEAGWFRFLVGLGLLGLIGGAYLWRTRALRRREEKLQRMVDQRTAQLAEEKKKTERQAQRLEALDEKKNRFFANVSHELRTPLTILKGTAQDLLDGAFGELPSPAQRQLEIMRSNLDRLRRLTNQLLDLSRLETAGPELNETPRDLVALLRQTVRSFVPLAERRGLDLELDTAVEAHSCRVDPEKLEKIVGNLLSNALQNTPEGGTVQVELAISDGDPPETVLRVVDTGRGIAPERQDEIFERFAHSGREDDDRTGTGIGLSLVREFVDLHDGTIALDSTPGEGSTFTVRLPLPPADPDPVEPIGAPQAETPPPMVPDEAPTPASGDGAPEGDDQPVLLIVEDNADVRAYLRRHLEDTYHLVEAPSGADGLDKARTIEPDLILTDLMMPEMDGIDLCQKIRADGTLSQTPVVLLTARAAEEDAVAGLEAGADAYVTKPFSMAELRAQLQRLLEAQWTGSGDEGLGLSLSPNVDVTPADEEFLARVTVAIDEHLSHPNFTVDDLAAEVGLSPRQLQRKLKRLTDTTPAAFIRQYRLDVAAQLLESEAGSVSEIAYEVGFGTLETFASRFEERFGCLPSTYPEEAPVSPSD